MARKYVIGDSFFHGEYIPLQTTSTGSDDFLYHKSHPPDHNHGHEDGSGAFKDFAEHAKHVSEELHLKTLNVKSVRDQLQDTSETVQGVEKSLEALKHRLEQEGSTPAQDAKMAATVQLAKHVLEHIHEPEHGTHDTPESHETMQKRHWKPPDDLDANTATRTRQNWFKIQAQRKPIPAHQDAATYLAMDNAKRLQENAKRLRHAKFPWEDSSWESKTAHVHDVPVYEIPPTNPLLDPDRSFSPPDTSPPTTQHYDQAQVQQLLEELNRHNTQHHSSEQQSSDVEENQPSHSIASPATETKISDAPSVLAYDTVSSTSSKNVKERPDTPAPNPDKEPRAAPDRPSNPEPDKSPENMSVTPHSSPKEPTNSQQSTSEPNSGQIFYNGQFFNIPNGWLASVLGGAGQAPSNPSTTAKDHPHDTVPLGEKIRTSGVEGKIRNPAILKLYRHFRSGEAFEDIGAQSIAIIPSSVPTLENILYLTQPPLPPATPSYVHQRPRMNGNPPDSAVYALEQSHESGEEYDTLEQSEDSDTYERYPDDTTHSHHKLHHTRPRHSGHAQPHITRHHKAVRRPYGSGYQHNQRHQHPHRHPDHAHEGHPHSKAGNNGMHHHHHDRRQGENHHRGQHIRHHSHRPSQHGHRQHGHRHHQRPEYGQHHAHHHNHRSLQKLMNQQAQQTSQQTIVDLLEKLSQTQKHLELPPVAAPSPDGDATSNLPSPTPEQASSQELEAAGSVDAPEPAPGGTKIGAIILGVLGALWLTYIGYISSNEE